MYSEIGDVTLEVAHALEAPPPPRISSMEGFTNYIWLWFILSLLLVSVTIIQSLYKFLFLEKIFVNSSALIQLLIPILHQI